MEQQKPHIMELITQAPWQEAVTYRDTWPHEYVLINRDGQKALLDEFCDRITLGEGVYCHFFHQTRPYLFLGDYKYWIMTDVADADPSAGEVVLNRALLYKDRRDFAIREGDTGKREDGNLLIWEVLNDMASETQNYGEFFQSLKDDLQQVGFIKKPTDHSRSFPSGFPKICYIASLEYYWNQDGAFVTLRLNKDRDSNVLIFRKLQDDKEHIEGEFNARLRWDIKTTFSDIYLYMDGSTSSLDKPDETRGWMRDTLLKFREVFNPRLEKILAKLE